MASPLAVEGGIKRMWENNRRNLETVGRVGSEEQYHWEGSLALSHINDRTGSMCRVLCIWTKCPSGRELKKGYNWWENGTKNPYKYSGASDFGTEPPFTHKHRPLPATRVR